MRTIGTIPDLITPNIHKKYEKTFKRLSLNTKKYLNKEFFKQTNLLPKRYEIEVRPEIIIKVIKSGG